MLWLVTPESPSLPKEKTKKTKPFSLFSFLFCFFPLHLRAVSLRRTRPSAPSRAHILRREPAARHDFSEYNYTTGSAMVCNSTLSKLSNFSNSEYVKMRRCLSCHSVRDKRNIGDNKKPVVLLGNSLRLCKAETSSDFAKLIHWDPMNSLLCLFNPLYSVRSLLRLHNNFYQVVSVSFQIALFVWGWQAVRVRISLFDGIWKCHKQKWLLYVPILR